jgi:hypothetical protein
MIAINFLFTSQSSLAPRLIALEISFWYSTSHRSTFETWNQRLSGMKINKKRRNPSPAIALSQAMERECESHSAKRNPLIELDSELHYRFQAESQSGPENGKRVGANQFHFSRRREREAAMKHRVETRLHKRNALRMEINSSR